MVPQGQNPKEISTKKEKGQAQKNESGFGIKTGSAGRSTGRLEKKKARHDSAFMTLTAAGMDGSNKVLG